MNLQKKPSMNNEYTIYFFYDTSKTLLYIGKTTNLRERIKHHLYPSVVENEPWKKEINIHDIIIYPCANKCDMDIYETYFINKYKPKYNRDKVYGVKPSFKLPYLEGIKYVFNPATMYTKQFLEYIDLRDSSDPDIELLAKYENEFPIFKRDYENTQKKESALIARELLTVWNSLSLKTRVSIMEYDLDSLKKYPLKWDSKTKLVVYN